MSEEAERAAVMAYLRAQRQSVLAIVENLDDDRMRQVTVPSGWTPLGLIEHLAHAERFWFQQVLTGRAAALPWPPDSGDSGDAFVTGHGVEEVLAFYREQCEVSDKALASTPFAATPSGNVPADMTNEIHAVRDIVLHMIEETARHAGHLDIARELIDGRTGLGPR
jgi:uncharacterized damage-inducible protein DinB